MTITIFQIPLSVHSCVSTASKQSKDNQDKQWQEIIMEPLYIEGAADLENKPLG